LKNTIVLQDHGNTMELCLKIKSLGQLPSNIHRTYH